MLKKLFALAGVSALTGLPAVTGAAGCTTETIEAAPKDDAGTTDANEPPVLASDNGGDDICYKDDPFDATTIPYEKARVLPGTCGANLPKVLDLLFANPQLTADALHDGLADQISQACADCAVAPDDGEGWAPVVWDGVELNENLGGCLEVVSGSEDCGRAYTQWMGCLNTVCSKCSTQAEVAACNQNTQSTACSDATQTLTSACGNNVNSYISACFPAGKPGLYQSIIKFCGGTPASDAGSDAGSD